MFLFSYLSIFSWFQGSLPVLFPHFVIHEFLIHVPVIYCMRLSHFCRKGSQPGCVLVTNSCGFKWQNRTSNWLQLKETYCLMHLWSPASAESPGCVVRKLSPSLGPASPSQLYPRGQFSRCGVFGPTPTAPALPTSAGGKHPFSAVSAEVWAEWHWPGSGLLLIFWTNICDSDWGALGHRLIPDLGQGGKCSKCKKTGLLLPEGEGVNVGQAENNRCPRVF